MAASSPSESWQTFAELIVFFFSLSACILLKLTDRQGKAYMDEIFHIPQVQHYCQGNFLQWDPMITTLPGLYINTIAIMKPVNWLLDVSMSVACSTFYLRAVNVAFATGNSILFLLLTRRLYLQGKACDAWKCLITATALSFFPLLYFFTFLYYTDAGSTFWVLLMYYLNLQHKHTSAAAAGTMAVLFRQTNIVWVVFCAGISVERNIIEWIQPEKKDIPKEDVQKFEFLFQVLRKVFNGLKQDTGPVRQLLYRCVADAWSYGLVCVAFIVFVWVNGSIVVGAKDDHQVSLNFPQLFYFAAFSAGFSFMHIISFQKVKSFFKFLYKHPFFVILFVGISAALIWKFTVAHKYLLADNRHYTFYVWSKVYRRHELVKYALIPVYLFAVWGISHQLWHQSGLWKLVFIVCVCVNLIPQMLLEFRYFIIPFLIYRLNMKPASYLALIIEILLYVVVNAATLYLFIEKPFKWAGQEDLQRFMW